MNDSGKFRTELDLASVGRANYVRQRRQSGNALLYNPSLFREKDASIINEIIRTARLATLVSNGASGLPEISHLPLIFDETEGPNGCFLGHFARANEHWKGIRAAGRAIVVFGRTDAYVSPSWYPGKAEHHKVVPTWNYEAVHAVCSVDVFDDPVRLLDVVSRLTKVHEDARSEPWTTDQMPMDFKAAQLRQIVGISLGVEQIEGKRKLSQNRTEEDREGVRRGLAQSDDVRDRAVAEQMTLIAQAKNP